MSISPDQDEPRCGRFTIAVDRQVCEEPPTHRHKQRGYPNAQWNYRCAEHALLLAPEVCILESLTEVA